MLHEENVQVQKWDEVANHGNLFAESRQGQEEGDELDSQEEASLAEMKSREVVLATERESWTSLASVVSKRRSYGHCLCDPVLHSSWDSNCVVLGSLRNAGRTLPN